MACRETDVTEIPVVLKEVYDEALYARQAWCPGCGEFVAADCGRDDFGLPCAVCGGDRACGPRHGKRNDFFEVRP